MDDIDGGVRDDTSAIASSSVSRAMAAVGALFVPAMSTSKQSNLKALYAAAVDARSSLPAYVERRTQPPRRSK